mgnify:CR=1 FL=1
MNKILLIIKREYLSRVKKKSFIVMTFLTPLLIAGIYALIGYFKKIAELSIDRDGDSVSGKLTRLGFTLAEVTLATAILAAAITTSIGVIQWGLRHLDLARGTTLSEVFRLHARSPLYAVPPDEEDAWVVRAIDAVWGQPATSLTRELSDGRAIWGLTAHPVSGGLIFVLRDVTALKKAA